LALCIIIVTLGLLFVVEFSVKSLLGVPMWAVPPPPPPADLSETLTFRLQ